MKSHPCFPVPITATRAYGPRSRGCSPAPTVASSKGAGQAACPSFMRERWREGATACTGEGLHFPKAGYGGCSGRLRDPDSTASHRHPRPPLTVLPARLCSPLPSPPFQSSCTVFLARALAFSPRASCALLIAGNLCKSPNIWILGSGQRVCV